ncbi:hypothetical protein E3T55_00485 [Cryobacterium frigoriphilum]|uniref:Uncharacterized protein n=1 Tax=Cryobacterium frigoriphilum TaxID=1259150 RepID=A0A4V6QIC9_9MICO|nr:hypothetical protein [Cryobacterium frigoriphilum]TFD55835.1 hypothetical protein E3T55_00485 [Cryobacterium frigoriphilum]
MSKRSIAITTTTITLAAAVIVAGLWVTGGDPLRGIQELVAPRSTMTVENVFNGFEGQPDLPVTNPQDITAEACSDEVRCSQAVRADQITVYRFEDRDDAEGFTAALGDNGYQSDWIVLEYQGAKYDTDSAESSYATVFDGTWTSE